MNKYVFISYSTKDRKDAFQLVNYLEDNHIQCWIAPRNIASGHDYTDSIETAIKECDSFLLLFSEHSAKSQWVKKEVTSGVSYERNIIPFKLTNQETEGGMNFMLNNLQWIVSDGHHEEKFPEVLEGLLRFDPQLWSENILKEPWEFQVAPTKRKAFIGVGVAAGVVGIALAAIFITRSGKGDELALADSLTIYDTAIAEPVQDDESPSPSDIQVQTAPSERRSTAVTARASESKSDNTQTAMVTPGTPTTTTTHEAAAGATSPTMVTPSFITTRTTTPTSTSPTSTTPSSTTPSSTTPTTPHTTSSTAATTPTASSTSTVSGAKTSASTTTSSGSKSQQTTQDANKKKYNKAVNLYNAQQYQSALKLFTELKIAGYKNNSLDTYIQSCREKLE